MIEINSLADVRPGDIMFTTIRGAVGSGIELAQLALGEAFRIGPFTARHVGIVTEAAVMDGPSPAEDASELFPGLDWRTTRDDRAVSRGARLVQAMPSGAEEIELREETHWTPRHAYVRLPEDYPGQGEDAAAIARLMVQEGVAYSFASYGALALWHWGVKTPRLERWIGRRRPAAIEMPWHGGPEAAPSPGWTRGGRLPVEAICSVLVDQAWSLAGKRVVHGTAPQVVSPGKLASSVFATRGVVWGGAGLL